MFSWFHYQVSGSVSSPVCYLVERSVRGLKMQSRLLIWLSTSLVTISQLPDFVVKALSTQSSFVLISLSSS
ncbi:unnamed protein product, partial [Brassica rapa]